MPSPPPPYRCRISAGSSVKGDNAINSIVSKAGWMPPAAGARKFFPPAVALHTVKIACELPDRVGCSLSQGDCAEIARQVVASGVVDGIAVETIRRMVAPHRLKPWRQHAWLSPTVPRDQAFCHAVRTVCDLYTRPLLPHEVVLGVDENTSLQPRPRRAPTLPASPDQPVRVEQEYQRQGALNLFAAFDTRTGQVYGQCHDRQRQAEFIEFWDLLGACQEISVTNKRSW